MPKTYTLKYAIDDVLQTPWGQCRVKSARIARYGVEYNISVNLPYPRETSVSAKTLEEWQHNNHACCLCLFDSDTGTT